MPASDAIVIGAGVIGMMTALELNRRGLKVSIIDKSRIGSESSWAGGGILSPLPPWQYDDAINSLTLGSASDYQALCQQLHQHTGIDPELLPSGMEVMLPERKEYGVATDWLEAHNLAWQASASDRLLLADIHQLRNPRLLQSLAAFLKQQGVQFIESCKMTGLKKTQQSIQAVETEQGTFKASKVIICAGAWAARLFDDVELAIEPVLGQMLLLRAEPGLLERIILKQGKYLIPRKDGHIVSGSTIEFSGFDKQLSDSFRKQQFDFSRELVPQLSEDMIVQHWCGLRPGSPDGRPWIDQHPKYRNLYIHAGHFRYGITMAPASTALLMNRMFGETNKAEIDAGQYALSAPRQSRGEFIPGN